MSFYNELTTELWFDARWNDESQHVLHRTPVATSRGIANEGGQSDPGSLALELRNADRRYSFANPTSALYGKLGRNTPIRTYVGTPHVGAVNSDVNDTTNHIAPSVDAPTDDGLLICAWAAPQPGGTYTVPAPPMTTGPSSTDLFTRIASAYQSISAAGPTGTRTATFSVTEDYVAASVILHGDSPAVTQTGGFSTALAPIPTAAGRWWVVLSYFGWFGTEDAGQPVPHFPRDNDGGGWIELGDTGSVQIGDADADWMRMKVWAKRVKTTGEHSLWIDNPGGLDSIQSVFLEVDNVGFWAFRSHAEVTSMPPRRDLSGNDRYVPVSASGLLHRLGHSSQRPLRSALERHVPATDPVAYWPLNGGTLSTAGQPAVGQHPWRRRLGAIRWGEVELAPWLGEGATFADPVRSDMVGNISMAQSPQLVTVRLVFMAEAGAGGSLFIDIGGNRPNGGAGYFIRLTAPDSIQLSNSFDLVLLDLDGGTFPDLFDGQPHLIQLGAGPNNPSAALSIDGVNVANVDGTGHQLTGIGDIRVSWEPRPDRVPLTIRDVSVWGQTSSLPAYLSAFRGYAGERPAERFARLCREEAVRYAIVGDTDREEVLLGPQYPGTLLEVLRDAEIAGGGLLYEPREFLGLVYRTVGSLYNQAPAATLDYANAEIAAPFEPTPDDRYTANDVTAKRIDGGTARSVQTAGPLNVSDPFEDPDGAGAYPTEPEVNVVSDELLPSQASWRRHLGTVDEPRYPTIAVNVVREKVLSQNPALVEALAALDPGDRIIIQNPPDDVPPDDITQLILGLRETIDGFHWDLAANTAPESPYHVASWASPQLGVAGNLSVAQSDSATLAEDLDTTEAGVDIICGAGPDWAHEVDYDIEIGGEQVTVTAVSAPAGVFPNRTQTLTVIRSVNGVVKDHSAGDRVLFHNELFIGL